MLTYCVKQRKKTQGVPGSETYVMTKNGRPAMKCKCAECGITKFRFLSQKEMRGAGFDELIVKGLAAGAKGLFNLGRKNVAEGIKSDFARNKRESGEQWPSEDAFRRRPLKLTTLSTFHGRNFAKTSRKEKSLFLIFGRVVTSTSGTARLQETKK